MTVGFIPNLHIICPEAEGLLYIPTGKTMVRRLMATGLHAAAQTLAFGDGGRVKASIIGEQRFIQITIMKCRVVMDTGIVALHNLGIEHPDLLGRDGTLNYNTAQRLAFTGKTLLGRMTVPDRKCSPPKDKEPPLAFKAELLETGTRDSGSEAMLAMKKIVTSTIPPSIFTGKLRLWVQAQYGRPLKDFAFAPNLANQPPSLDWSTTSEFVEYAKFQIHSCHTGIYTDSDWRHWFVQFNIKGSSHDPNKVNIFRMKTSDCAEKLRPLLVDGKLSAENADRVEAYILAHSLPEFDFCVSKDCKIDSLWSMGYGWHFNWTGSQADMVCNPMIGSGSSTQYESTHYRISLHRTPSADDPTLSAQENEVRRWTVVTGSLETKRWQNQKWVQTIAHPNWATRQLEVFGYIWGIKGGSNAPVYAFYTRDDHVNPKVLRYSYSGDIFRNTWECSSSPSYWKGSASGEGVFPGFPCVVNNLYGGESGSSTSRARTSDPVSTSFSLGSVTISGVRDHTTDGIENVSVSITGSNMQAFAVDFTSGPLVTGPNGSAIVEQGPYGCEIGVSWDLVTISSQNGTVYEASYNTMITDTIVTGFTDKAHYMLAVIPVGDAEAVYLTGTEIVGVEHSGATNYSTTTDRLYWPFRTGTFPSGAVLSYATAMTTSTAAGSDPYSNFTSTASDLGSHCISNAGTIPFTPGSLSAFRGGEGFEQVSAQFFTRTSAGYECSIDGHGITLTDGYDTALTDTNFVFVGWA